MGVAEPDRSSGGASRAKLCVAERLSDDDVIFLQSKSICSVDLHNFLVLTYFLVNFLVRFPVPVFC